MFILVGVSGAASFIPMISTLHMNSPSNALLSISPTVHEQQNIPEIHLTLGTENPSKIFLGACNLTDFPLSSLLNYLFPFLVVSPKKNYQVL